MNRMLVAFTLAVSVALTPSMLVAQETKTKAPATPAAKVIKAGKGEKVCRHRFPSGEQRSWVCKQEQPCCAWDLISYVKCGSTITGCL